MLELFGTAACPYTQDLREWLEMTRRDFIEYDVERDEQARARLRTITPGQRTVPVLAEDGKAIEIGWRGRGCVI